MSGGFPNIVTAVALTRLPTKIKFWIKYTAKIKANYSIYLKGFIGNMYNYDSLFDYYNIGATKASTGSSWLLETINGKSVYMNNGAISSSSSSATVEHKFEWNYPDDWGTGITATMTPEKMNMECAVQLRKDEATVNTYESNPVYIRQLELYFD